jgi:hypothetical protein
MKAKQNIAQFIFGISILVLGINVVGAVEPFENLPDDTVLVEVLGQKVQFKDINPASNAKKKQQESTTSEQFALWLKQTRSANMGRYFRPLLDNYAKEKGLTVTEQEVKECKESMIAFMTSEQKRWKTNRDNLAKELIAENLKDDKKAELEKSFNLYGRLLERSPDLNLIYHSADSNTAKSVDDTMKAFILTWKIKKELYKQYKGRVIFQQAGVEPLDAFRQFFEEQQASGKFKFYNKGAEDLFWDYYRNVRHSVYKDQNEAERFINTPPGVGEREEDYYANTETGWGDDVNGFQIRVKGVRGGRIFDSDKVPAFKMDLLNTGDNTFSCATLEQFCEVEVDGKWYKWNGPQAGDITSIKLSPKRVYYDFFEIKLAENWVLKEFSGEKDKSRLIPLSLGTHVVRVKYKTMAMPESPPTEAVSNSLKFQIIPPKSEKKE